jgi:hypothetical protein
MPKLTPDGGRFDFEDVDELVHLFHSSADEADRGDDLGSDPDPSEYELLDLVIRDLFQRWESQRRSPSPKPIKIGD